jgi:hypothetical protein
VPQVVHWLSASVVQVSVSVQLATSVHATQVSAVPSTRRKPGAHVVHWLLLLLVHVPATAQLATTGQTLQTVSVVAVQPVSSN